MDNKALQRRLMEEVWGEGKLELIDELLDPEFAGADPLRGPLTREGYRSLVKGYRRAFPDLKFEFNAVTGDENFVAVRWTARATHRGPFLGTPSTGKAMTVTGISFAEFRNGKIVSEYSEWDALGMLRQLGIDDVTVPLAVRRPRDQQHAP